MSFEIHPETPLQGVAVSELFGGADLRAMEEGLRRRAAGYGLPYGRSDILSNSRAAIEAAEYAREEGRFEPFHREVFAAYFARGMDIGDVDVLTGLAETAGLDAGGLREALDAGRYAGRREEVAGEAARLGISGVPTFIFAGGARVVGAQPLEKFRDAARFSAEA